MEEGDLKTSPRKDVTNVDHEAVETTLPNGFDDPLLFGAFKFVRKALSIRRNDALTTLLTPKLVQVFHRQEMQNNFI